MILRAGQGGLFASPDDGRSWYGLPHWVRPGVINWVEAVAIDLQRPGHIVLAGGGQDVPGFNSASGCNGEGLECNKRPIAFNYDASAELLAAVNATYDTGGISSDDAQRKLDQLTAGWGYASIAHLATDAATAAPGDCKLWLPDSSGPVNFGSTAAPKYGLGSLMCAARPGTYSHAVLPSAGNGALDPTTGPRHRDFWCLDYDSTNCQCENHPRCRYPNGYPALAIDPRNGFGYLSTDVGLLTSRDGGSRWERGGQCSVAAPDAPPSLPT